MSPRIVVIGAGYAGAHAARAAHARGAQVTVVDSDGHHEFGPRLATVAAGATGAGDAWADLADLVGVAVERQRAVRVDEEAREVVLADGRSLAFDAVVVTVGAEAAVPDIPGLAEHALTLKTARDALQVRRALEGADRLTVVGGGATGTQLAGEVAAAHPGMDVALVEATDRLMPSFPRSLGAHARRVLTDHGVAVHLSRSLVAVDADGAHLDDDSYLPGTVVWAGGFTASGRSLLPDAPSYGGRLRVDRALRARCSERVFVAGDAASHRDLLGRPLQMSAQIAVQAGAAAGANAVRVARGEPVRPAHLLDLGWVATLGGGRGVAQVGPVRLAAPLVDRTVPFLHWAVDVRHLFQLGGLAAVADHAPGLHEPAEAEVDAVARPLLRTVG